MHIEFSTQEFVRSHGKEPRGWGNWGFFINGEIFWHTGKFAEAKKMAKAMAVTLKAQFVSVAP